MTKRFEISMSVSNVPDWGIVEAVREVFQNSLDNGEFTYTFENGQLDVISKNVNLERKTLLIGMSDKRNDPDKTGKHGEGYKLAALITTRMDKQFTIYNSAANEIWYAKIIESRRYGSPILAFDIEDCELQGSDLIFQINGITKGEWYEIIKKNLHTNDQLKQIDKIETEYGDIIFDKSHRGIVYVNGLYVSKIPVSNYLYGYNVKSRYLDLDRDRRCVNGFDFKTMTSSMWLELCEKNYKTDLICKLIEQDVPDVEHVEWKTTYGYDTTKNSIAENFLHKHGKNIIACSTDEDIKIANRLYTNAKTVIVKENYKKILNNSKIYNNNKQLINKRKFVVKESPKIILEESYNKLCDNLSPETLLKEFNKLIGMSKEWEWKN